MNLQTIYVALALVMVAPLGLGQAASSAPPTAPGAEFAPAAQSPKQIKPGRPFVDPCGTLIDVAEGSVTVKFSKDTATGKWCISKITVGGDDKATITLLDGVDVEISVSGKAEVTINANELGEKSTEDLGDSDPGINVSGDGGFKNGQFEGSVAVVGANNVISISGKNHEVSVTGDGNVILNKGSSNCPVITTGSGNTVY